LSETHGHLRNASYYEAEDDGLGLCPPLHEFSPGVRRFPGSSAKCLDAAAVDMPTGSSRFPIWTSAAAEATKAANKLQ
jgi:hypothetical protein